MKELLKLLREALPEFIGGLAAATVLAVFGAVLAALGVRYASVGSGTAYADKGDYDHAIADFDQAIRLKPDLAVAYNHRGLAYKLKGEREGHRRLEEGSGINQRPPTGGNRQRSG